MTVGAGRRLRGPQPRVIFEAATEDSPRLPGGRWIPNASAGTSDTPPGIASTRRRSPASSSSPRWRTWPRPWINEKERLITLPDWVTRNSKEHTFPYGQMASDVMMLPRAATGGWIIAGSGVSEERSYQRQRLRDM